MAQAGREAVESFTIMTTEPNELVRPIHNRMPVILRQEDEEQWLDVSRTAFAKGHMMTSSNCCGSTMNCCSYASG
jgi:putative SOS response-associated peptidase YedK